MWRHRGRQHKETCRTFNEAREKKSLRDSVDSKPVERARFGDYFPDWIETYAGRTQRGFSETTRPEYRRTIANFALPRWKTLKLSEIEPKDVRGLLMAMRNEGKGVDDQENKGVTLCALRHGARGRADQLQSDPRRPHPGATGRGDTHRGAGQGHDKG